MEVTALGDRLTVVLDPTSPLGRFERLGIARLSPLSPAPITDKVFLVHSYPCGRDARRRPSIEVHHLFQIMRPSFRH